MSGAQRSRWLLLAAGAVASGCNRTPSPGLVRIDLDRLARTEASVAAVQTTPPPDVRPPGPLAAKSESIAPRPAEKLVTDAGIDGEALAREVVSAQEASLSQLRRRLSDVYRREADRFARAQMREMGDPYQKALDRLYPAYRKSFEAYAQERSFPAARLAFAVGTKDPNPQDDPPPPGLTPIAKYFFNQASTARKELKVLDAKFDEVVRKLLADVDAEGVDARTRTLALIEANRDALNRQALAEATLPLTARGKEPIRLTLAQAAVATVPAVPAHGVTLPPVAAPPGAPRVESPGALVDERARLRGEARIWASLNGFRLDPGGRDATAEFAKWIHSRAGASSISR